MGKVLLVTGTDTGVGKTVVTAWLGLVLRGRYRSALVKAVQTGADPLVDGDEASYRAMLGDSDVTTATVCRLPDPLAPSIAAQRAGTKVDFEGVTAACLDIASRHDVTLVEGSGGLLVPITERHDFAALALALDATLILVARPGLGTLNHTLLTQEAAASRGLRTEMLVCNGLSDRPGMTEMENLRFFERRWAPVPVVVLRRASDSDRILGDRILESLDPGIIGETPDLLRHAGLRRFPWE